MDKLLPLIDYIRDARIARCRVIKWHVDEPKAWDMAGVLCEFQYVPQWEMFYRIKAGECWVLGAQIEMRP